MPGAHAKPSKFSRSSRPSRPSRPSGECEPSRPARFAAIRVRRFPFLAVLRLGGPSEIWFKPALSVVAAVAPPNFALLALGRLDLAMYTMAGGLCALYAHSRPYAARARVLALVAAGMLAGLAVALVVASLTSDALVLVLVGALLAAVQKTVCDATRVGPPGHVILTFISSAALFAPQSLGQVPGHLGLTALAGAWAWIVGMAPGLLRPHGPERRMTAQALRATAAYAATGGTGEGAGRARAAAAAAVQAAWQSLLPPTRPTPTRLALRRLLVRAEVALAAPADTDPDRLRTWALALRGNGPVPEAEGLGEAAEELLGADIEAKAAHDAPARPLREGLGHLAPSHCARHWAAPSPVPPRSRSASGARTGPWSPPPPCTRSTSRSPGAAPSSGSSATSSASCSSRRSPRWPTSPRWSSCCAAWPSTSPPRRSSAATTGSAPSA